MPVKINKKWSVYIVLCKDNTLYTGVSNNVAKRFEDHCAQNQKTAKYLRGRTPLKLIYTQEIGTRSDALKVEAAIKKMSQTEKYALIYGAKTK